MISVFILRVKFAGIFAGIESENKWKFLYFLGLYLVLKQIKKKKSEEIHTHTQIDSNIKDS